MSFLMQPPDGWVAAARPVPAFGCDAIYPIVPDLYVGPGNGFTPEQWRDLRVPVPPPDLALTGPRHVAATTALARPEALAEYYRGLIALVCEHGVRRSLRHAFPLFAVEPAIIADGAILTSFEWYEGASFTREVLTALVQGGTGDEVPQCGTGDDVLWNGMDQGWAGQFSVQGDRIGFVAWNPDGPDPVPQGIGLDRADLAAAAAAALARFDRLQAGLIGTLGRDYWD